MGNEPVPQEAKKIMEVSLARRIASLIKAYEHDTGNKVEGVEIVRVFGGDRHGMIHRVKVKIGG